MTTLSNGKIITGYYGQDGVMSEGWDTEEEATAEFEAFYQDDDQFQDDDLEVVEYNGKWVIAY